VLSIVTLLVVLNKIFNILGERFYKHPKEYVVHPGETLSSATLAPIFFVFKEKKESDLILKHLEEYISTTFFNMKSIPKSVFLSFFLDHQSKDLDKQKIVNMIETVVSRMPANEFKQLSHYCSTQNSRKSLIQHLIINQLTLWQLDSDQETKSIFNSIKDKWIEIVYWDTSLSEFALKHSVFEKIVEEKLPKPSSSQKEQLLQLNDGSLLDANLNLLRDSILAYTFECHQINILPAKVEVSMKERVNTDFIRKFLKRDLKSIHKINYGIDYEITDDILNFSGTPKRNVEGKTLVIQIATTRNRMLKEIWIHGASAPLVKQQIIPESNYERL